MSPVTAFSLPQLVLQAVEAVDHSPSSPSCTECISMADP